MKCQLGDASLVPASFLPLCAILGEGHGALVQAKLSVAPLLTEKHDGFDTRSFQNASELPEASRVPQMPPETSSFLLDEASSLIPAP